MSEKRPLAVVGSIHGGEPLGAEVVDALPEMDGVVKIVGHPEAVAKNVRYLGDYMELGSQFPGDHDSDDPDTRRAAELHDWLKQHDPWLIVSIHNNYGMMPGPDYVVVPQVTSPAALAVANLVGINHVTVSGPYPFYDNHPQIIETEQALLPETDKRALIGNWIEAVDTMRQLGQDGMAAEFEQQKGQLQYFQELIDIPLCPNGQVNQPVMDRLDEFEHAIPDEEIRQFNRVELPGGVRQALSLGSEEVNLSVWDYRSMSKIVDGLGHSSLSGLPRRQYFGRLYAPVAAPGVTGPSELTFHLSQTS